MFWEEPLEGVALTPRTDGSVSTGLVAQFKTESWLRHTVICTQRCIVHLMRNSTRYIPRKRWAEFAKDIKAVYKAVSLDEATALFETFQTKWDEYHSAVNVWAKNWDAVARLFELPSAIRKIIYTTNTIESYHNQLRKVTNRKGAFPSEMALFKLVYLRIDEIRRTWDRPIQNWGQVLNQLVILYGERVSKHIRF